MPYSFGTNQFFPFGQVAWKNTVFHVYPIITQLKTNNTLVTNLYLKIIGDVKKHPPPPNPT